MEKKWDLEKNKGQNGIGEKREKKIDLGGKMEKNGI